MNFLRRIVSGATRKCLPLLRVPPSLQRRMTFERLRSCNLDRTLTYHYATFFFDRFLPREMRDHRTFFTTGNRGFGEDAFHTMWFLLFEHKAPRSALEIGVYRGQLVTLWALLTRHFGHACDVAGVSPFTSIGDSVSTYENGIDYLADTIQNHRRFDLPLARFCRASSQAADAQSFISSRSWDVIYIDGNHEYDCAKQDWETCSNALSPRGIIVLDDASLYTDYRPPPFATAGHPGPSRLAEEISKGEFREIFAVGHNRVFARNPAF